MSSPATTREELQPIIQVFSIDSTAIDDDILISIPETASHVVQDIFYALSYKGNTPEQAFAAKKIEEGVKRLDDTGSQSIFKIIKAELEAMLDKLLGDLANNGEEVRATVSLNDYAHWGYGARSVTVTFHSATNGSTASKSFGIISKTMFSEIPGMRESIATYDVPAGERITIAAGSACIDGVAKADPSFSNTVPTHLEVGGFATIAPGQTTRMLLRVNPGLLPAENIVSTLESEPLINTVFPVQDALFISS